MISGKFALALIGILVVLAGCDGPDTGNELKKINGSVHVAAGTAPQAAGTVNGRMVRRFWAALATSTAKSS